MALARPGAGTGAAAVLEAAAIAFMRNGYDATTIDDVADVMGSTKGRLYHYYRAKSDIYLDVLRTGMDMMLGAVRPHATADGPAPDRLREMARAHGLLIMAHLPFQKVAVQAVQSSTFAQGRPQQQAAVQEIVALRDEYEQLFADVIAQGAEAGELRTSQPRVDTKAVLGVLNWITVWYRPERSSDDSMRQIADTFADFIVRGLTP